FSFHYAHWALNHIDYSGGVAKRWECDDLKVGVTTAPYIHERDTFILVLPQTLMIEGGKHHDSLEELFTL
ncbi:unnamed protein product, partial [Porites evermanni]